MLSDLGSDWRTALAQLLIDETGCIRIPMDIQDRFGLEPGTSLVLEEADDGGLRLRARENAPADRIVTP
jgi:bifunctional DNA-binding transcriptional regulator/antitoxin component of YhaV-PrlF toxin-antitoxin module